MFFNRNDQKFAALMLQAQRQEEITLRGSVVRAVFWALICFVIAVVTYAFPGDGDQKWRYILPVLFIGGGLIIFFSGRSAVIHLTPAGLSFQFNLKHTFIPWEDVVSFNTSLAGIVGLDYRQNDAPIMPGAPDALRKSTLPGEFELKQRQLILLMDSYRAEALERIKQPG